MDFVKLAKSTRSSRAFTVGALSLCLVTYTLLYGLLIPVLPTVLVERMSVSTHNVQRWISILLSLEAAATLLASLFVSYLVDLLHSRRLTLLVGIVLLGAAMAVIGTSRSVKGLVAGRILQGVSSAAIQVVSNAVIRDCAPDNAVGQYLGYAGTATNFGFLSGPLLGGVVFQYLNWDGLFAIVGGLLFVNLLVPLAILPNKREQYRQGRETLRATTSLEIRDRQQEALFSRFKSLMTTNMYIEIWASFVTGIFISAIDSVIALFVEEEFHWNTLGQGLVFLPVAVPALLEPIFGWFADTYGPRLTGSIGFAILVPASILFRLVTSNTLSSKVVLCTLLGCIGVALDVTDPAGYLLVDSALKDSLHTLGNTNDEEDRESLAFGIQHSAQYLGITIGPFVVLIFPASGRLGSVGLLLGSLSALTAIVWLLGVHPYNREAEREESIDLN